MGVTRYTRRTLAGVLKKANFGKRLDQFPLHSPVLVCEKKILSAEVETVMSQLRAIMLVQKVSRANQSSMEGILLLGWTFCGTAILEKYRPVFV